MRPASWMMKLLLTVSVLFSFSASAIPISGPAAPSLTGTKYSSSIQLDWNSFNSCNSATYEIQESTNASSWSTVYTGAGNSGGDNASFTRSTRKVFGGDNLGGGDGCNVIGGGPLYISLSGRTNEVYYYKIRTCEIGICGQYGSTLQLGEAVTPPPPPPPPTPSIVIEQLSYHIYQDSSGKLYLVRPPIFVPIAGEIFIPIFLADKGNVIVMTESGGNWALSEISYDQFLATNAAKKEQAAVKYQNLERGADLDLIISLDGQFNNSFVISDINANVHTVSEQDISAEAWRSIAYTAVDNTAGSNTAPSETINLSASVLKGKAGVSGGQASYQIPIDLPPGRNGIQPRVALSYNSQGGNGTAGVGWSLNAGSAISRCGATYAQDGFTRAVTFNADTDKLCFNGQRLITSGSYGTSGTEYRTEMDSFVKVIQSGGINGTSTSFTVYRPDGSQATYGSNANSRFAPAGLTTSLTWKVTQESWANGNNTIDYEYDTSVAGEHLLSKVYYTGSAGTEGNRYVEFIYENRTDNRKSYMAGGQLITQRRLKNINTYSGTSRQIAKYKLGYGLSDASKRSLLKNVQQCGFNSGAEQCSPLTRFSWSETASKVVLDEYTVIDDGISKYPLRGLSGEKFQAILPFGDIDGDGTLDSLSYYTSAEQAVIREHEIELKNSSFDNLTYSTTTVMFDANQDGKTDNFKVDAGYLHIALSTDGGMGPFFNTGVSMPEIKDSLLNAADYNGDGWPDLIIRKGQQPAYSNAKLYLYPHSGNANYPYSESRRQLVHTYSYNSSDPGSPFDGISFVGDADGNGLPDILITNKVLENAFGVSSSWPRTFLLNQGDSFSSKNLPSLSRNTGIDSELFEFMMDINGDGLVDWLYWESNDAKPRKPNELWYRLNNGKAEFAEAVSFNQAVLESRSYATLANNSGEESVEFSFPKYSNAFKVMDIDGDGVPELLTPGERLLESCGKIDHATVQKQVCGDKIYEQYQVAHTPGVNRPIPLGLDKSIYRYNAIKFELNANGQIEPVTVNTSFIGTPQASMVDMFGDGLVDMLFVFKTHVNTAIYPDLASTNLVAEEGHYISRNYGAGNGNSYSDYAATDYLQSITDGIGNQSQWRYRPLSTGEESAGQTKMYHTDHEYVGDGYIHFGSSMYVVQSFEQNNGIGGTNETEYAYKGAMYNLQGRGFTGFRELIEKDVSRNRVTTNVFKQKFPEVSLLESQTVKVNGTTVSTTAKTWADNPQHTISGVYHNINTSTTTHNYGLSGSNEQRSIVQQAIDTADATEHGNIKKHTKIVTDYIDGDANSYQTVVDTVFTPDTSNWFLGKFNSKTTTTSVIERSWSSDPLNTSGQTQWQKLTVGEWHPLHHKPTEITYTASGSSCDRVETTTLNDYGLPTQVSVTGESSSCASLTSRATSFTYTKNGSSQADDGYLPYQITNAKGHISKTEYDMGLGVPIKVTAPNSIITQTQYDAIGRPVQMSQTGSPTSYLRYLLASSGSHAPTHAKVMTRTTSAGMPSQETYLDSLGRSLRSATQAFDGSNYQYLDKKYDSLGHLTHESLPYYDGNTPEYTIFSGFDGFDRPTSRSLPNGESGGLISTYDYTGLKTDISVEGRTMSRTYGMQGLLYETVDAAGGSNRFAYDGAGRPLVIQDANNSKIKASYNGFGHKTEVDDPNQGITTFGYSSLGELDTQTDENGVTKTFALDTLGRITSKTITGSNANGTASYTWDTLKKGMLSSESENGISRSYTYTSKLQLATSSVKVASSHGGDNVTRTVKHQYDGFYGRPKALTYPNNLTLEYRYNDAGYLNQTRNAASGYIYRTVTDMDAAGHLTGSQMANALLTQSSSYNGEGTMASTQVTSSLGLLHNHYYDQYDSFMNLTAEHNAVSGLEKSYAYDNLNRLEQYSFSNSGFAIYDNPIKFAATVDYGYDAVGNLLKKSDYSINSNNAYEYGGSCGGPNRVCAITKELNHQRVTFNYDSRGNLLVGDDLTMTYNALDKPLTIIGRGPGNNTNTGFVYGSDNMRALQTRTVSGSTTKTHYVDKLFETDNDGSWRAYIADIAVLSYTPQKSHQLLYTLRDRLGSATTMVDHLGNEISRRYFDPFGRTATETAVGSFGDLLDTNRNRRGFTDHEHLNEQKLIHMNGRVYDYNMGRFMSVDPLIQSPTSTQSINPYSYIMNNPLAGTDPTGYKSEVELKKVEYTKKTEKVAVTGSRIKREVTTSVSGTATYSNGATQSFSASYSNGKLSSASVGGMSSVGSLQQTAAKSGGDDTVKNAPSSDNSVTVSPNDADTTKAAGILAVGWGGAAAEPTPIGEVTMGVVTLAAAAYYGPELMEKMRTEIDGIMKKATGPDGVQYSLRATKDGIYPCFNCSSGVTNLKVGDVWKFGETTNPTSRYSPTFLRTNNLRQVNEFYGNRVQIKVVEKMKIYNHALTNFSLPPGNRIFR